MGVDGICIAFAFCGPLRRGRFLLPIIFVWPVATARNNPPLTRRIALLNRD
jgi:hypothetical protein